MAGVGAAVHVTVFCVTVLWPLHDVLLWFPPLLRAVSSFDARDVEAQAEAARARRRFYAHFIAVSTAVACCVLAVVAISGHSLSLVGVAAAPPITLPDFSSLSEDPLAALQTPGLGFWLSVLLVGWSAIELLVMCLLPPQPLVVPLVIAVMLPQQRSELPLYAGMCVCAGVVEELVYRGFLLFYFDTLCAQSVLIGHKWDAILVPVLLSAICFGIAHLYQSTLGVLRSGLVGVLLALIYRMSGILWPAMVIHALMDLSSGIASVRGGVVLEDDDKEKDD